ncbi:MAG: hypothetical protein Q9166_000526 [cf. Caloplaca sp. 2 TL-2023]
MTILSEADVLGPVNPKLHSDDWPIHHLKNVNIISQQTQQSVSLLDSNKDHAVQVTGVLEAVDSPQGRKLLDGRSRNKRIEISDVSFWAFSEEDDRSVCLWASGRAGWFELHDPVPHYQAIFKGMTEAVSMFYHLADKYKRLRSNSSHSSVSNMNKFVRSAFHDRQDIYGEVDLRLNPQRQPKQAKTKPPTTQSNNQRKQTSMARGSEYPRQQMTTGRSTRRHPGPEVPRTPRQPSIPNDETDTSGDEEYDSNGKVIEAGTKRKSRSILQPKGSKFSKKAAARRQNLPSLDGPGEASTESDEEVTMPESSPLAAVSQRGTPYPYHLPRKTTEVEMVAYDIPSDQPQGPGDLWTCQFENCNKRVHEASKPKGKEQIKSHFQEHARRAQEKIDLALAESRPYLPVT